MDGSLEVQTLDDAAVSRGDIEVYVKALGVSDAFSPRAVRT